MHDFLFVFIIDIVQHTSPTERFSKIAAWTDFSFESTYIQL